MASMPTALRENEGKTRRDRQLEYVLLRFLSAAAASGFPDIRSRGCWFPRRRRLSPVAAPPSLARLFLFLSVRLVPRHHLLANPTHGPLEISTAPTAGVCRLYSLFFSRLSGRKLSFPGLSLLFLCVYLYLALSVCPSLSFSPTFLVPLQPL